MRAVADALGTAAGSLYRYVSSRDDLVDLMVDAVLAELPLEPSPDGWWLDNMVALARDQLALHRHHPWLVETFPSTGPFGPHATDLFEHHLRTLAPVARTVSAKMEAIAMVTGVVSLFARTRSADPERPPAPTSLFPTADAAAHPRLVTALAQPDPSPPSADLFDRTIRSVLNGLLADAAPPVDTGRDGA
jgi:AcrR family transcriptional regulator